MAAADIVKLGEESIVSPLRQLGSLKSSRRSRMSRTCSSSTVRMKWPLDGSASAFAPAAEKALPEFSAGLGAGQGWTTECRLCEQSGFESELTPSAERAVIFPKTGAKFREQRNSNPLRKLNPPGTTGGHYERSYLPCWPGSGRIVRPVFFRPSLKIGLGGADQDDKKRGSREHRIK
jgi:hypothetical protein